MADRVFRPSAPVLNLASILFLFLHLAAAAQDPSSIVTTLNVAGRVVNALTGAAIPRALVTLNGRTVLTDPLGQFNFPGFQPNGPGAGIQAYALVSKPGYSFGLDAADRGSQQLNDVTAPLELKLYPDGLISGTVTKSDGEPLARVQISIFREMGDEASRHLQQVGFIMTNSRGEYRTEQSPGRYSLLLRYVPRGGEDGQAILPQRYPVETAEATLPSFVLGPGDQLKIDLQARTGIAYPVTFRTETSAGGSPNFRIAVRCSTGESFTVFAQPSGTGEFRIELPSGSYSLHAVQQVRERLLEAESSITVAGHAATGSTLRFIDIPSIPVHVLLDTATSGSTSDLQVTAGVPTELPTPMNLNLRLEKVGGLDEESGGQLRVATLPNGSFAIQTGSGSYRLAAAPGSQWYIVHATYGTTDLFTHPLTVTSGAGGESIRITVSNAFGQITGTMRNNGVAAAGFIYFLPHEASLIPVYTVRASREGSYAQTVPPGTYTVLAFANRVSGDLRDPALQSRLSHGSATVQVTAGGQSTLDLDQQTMEKVE